MVYMDRFLRLASAHGIAVYWVLMPISPELQALSDASGADAQYVSSAPPGRAFPNVVVLDGWRTPGYGPGRFMDLIHLDGKGAAALSNELADLMLQPPEPRRPRNVARAPTANGRRRSTWKTCSSRRPLRQGLAGVADPVR